MAEVTPANVNDALPAVDLLDAIPPIQGPTGRPRFRPDIFQADMAYGTPDVIHQVKARGVIPLIAPQTRNPVHGSGLGQFRYVVERTLAWFGHNRRLKVCYERSHVHLQAFHTLAAALICAKKLSALNQVLK